VLVLAIAVGLAMALSSWQFFLPRSTGSLAVGTTMLAASFAELFLVPLLAYRFAVSKYAGSKRVLLCLLAGIAAATPAVGTLFVGLST
jgi:membrane protein YdbS with pleckstrin-like domain